MILVSEIMLQQTQAARVQEKIPAFLGVFPTLQALARASRSEVLQAWRGMGYNNRAVRLSDLARIVTEQHRGRLPEDTGRLLRLPGIGPYTAEAIRCFAFRKHTAVVDVNVRRVLSRLFWKMDDPAALVRPGRVWNLAGEILPRDSFSWNQALMDLGASICTARNPRCGSCPVRVSCRSKSGMTNRRAPAAAGKKEPSYHGVPRRIWRGRIVEALRNSGGNGTMTPYRLGKSVKPGFAKEELPWLRSVIGQLERDGIVSRVRSRVRLSAK